MLGNDTYWFTWFPGAMLAFLGILGLGWKSMKWLVTATGTLKQLQISMPIIEAEFSPDHGHSMKDRVEALHDKQDRLARDTGKWQSQHARDDDRRFAQVEGSLERIEGKL